MAGPRLPKARFPSPCSQAQGACLVLHCLPESVQTSWPDLQGRPALFPTTSHFIDNKHLQIDSPYPYSPQQCFPTDNVYMNSLEVLLKCRPDSVGSGLALRAARLTSTQEMLQMLGHKPLQVTKRLWTECLCLATPTPTPSLYVAALSANVFGDRSCEG